MKAPWTEDQVESLNAFQTAGVFHPFTCGSSSCRAALVARSDGWRCHKCKSYTQNWCFVAMADWSWKKVDPSAMEPASNG